MDSLSGYKKKIKNSLHDSFKKFRMRWLSPDNKTFGDKTAYYKGPGLELYIGGKRNRKRFFYVFNKGHDFGLDMSLEEYFTIYTPSEAVECKSALIRFLSVINKETTEDDLMICLLSESNLDIRRAINWRIKRLDKEYFDE